MVVKSGVRELKKRDTVARYATIPTTFLHIKSRML